MELISAIPLGMETVNLDLKEICLRLLCAMIIGLVIGMEREHTHRPAGMRTHILVALGSCVVMIIGQMIFIQYKPFGAVPDPARMGAQVVSGVSFLGAGTIMREGVNVKGLTTAASLWAVACLGLAAGAGYYVVSVAGMLLVFVTLTVMEVLQHKLFVSDHPSICFHIEADSVSGLIDAIGGHTKACGMHLCSTELRKNEDGGLLILCVSMGRKNDKKVLRFCRSVLSEPSVRSIKQMTPEDSREEYRAHQAQS